MAIEQDFSQTPPQALYCPPGEARAEWVESSSGLRLRVTSTGARAWSVAYYSPAARHTRRLKLGNAATLPLAKARRLARAALAAVDAGHDPFADRVAARQQEREARRVAAQQREASRQARARRAVTFGKLCEDYIEWRQTTSGGRTHRPASPRSVAGWRSMLKLHIQPAIGSKAVGEMRLEDFVHTLEGAVKRGGPSMGPRVREMLSAVWHWTEGRKRLLGVELPAESPLVGLPRDIGDAVSERERVLTPAEIWSFWRATESEGLAGLALRLMLLTASRVREVTGLPWAEVDTAAKTWTLAAARNKGARVRAIPLSPQALDTLKATGTQSASAPGAAAYVFKTPHLPLNFAMNRIRAAMGASGGAATWQPRDLRRTAATLVARLGADPFVVALVLGHATTDARVPGVTNVYLRWRYDDRVREALDRLSQWIEETVAAPQAPGGVVQFSNAAGGAGGGRA